MISLTVMDRLSLLSGILSLLLGGLITIPAALAISHKASKPRVELEAAVTRIGTGDFVTPVAVTGNDEFGRVATAVNAMAAGLKERDRVKSTFAHSRIMCHIRSWTRF